VGKKSTPKPPDLTPLSDAQLAISKEQLEQAREQMQMSQSQFDKFTELTNKQMAQSQDQYEQQMALQSRALDQADAAAAISKSVADKQIASMDQSLAWATEDRNRYEQTFLPLQDQFIQEAKDYSTPERREQAASQALADNQAQLEAQKRNTAASLASMGVDPSQVMSTSLASQLGVAGAANGAFNANNAREQTSATGRQLLAGAINMGNGLPAQVNAGQATATNSGNSAAGNTNAATNGFATASGIGQTAAGITNQALNTAGALTGTAGSWAQIGQSSYGGASNGIMNASSIQNQQFQNQMAVQQMKNDQSAATMNAIGSMAGAAAGMMMAEGGAVDDQQLPPIDWETIAQSIPQDYHIDDPERVVAPHVRAQSPGRPEWMGKVGGALGAISAGTSAYGDTMDSSRRAPPVNYLHPIMRAEGGAMNGDNGAVRIGGRGQYRVMPNVQSRDVINAQLAPGELVIPADVVRIKGQEFFDKMINKHHRPGA